VTHRADFLAGLRVLELGDGVAGAAATGLLWALGAEVTSVVDPSSPHRRGRPAIGDVSLLARALDRGKDLVDEEPHSAGFDVAVVDQVLRGCDDLPAYVEGCRGGTRVTISAFGLTGERAGEGASELTVAAASGMLSAVRDPATGRPLKLAGQQSLLNTGQAAALAACHALDLAADGPVHLDLSAVEATLAMGPVLEVGGLLLETGSLGGAKRYGSPADFYLCTDGLVRISAMEDHQWQGVVSALGSPDWADRFATVQSRIDGAEEVDEHVAAWTATRSKVEAETVLQANGVPATAVYAPSEILASPQLAHRDAFEPLPVDDRKARVVGLPFQVVARSGEPKRRSLRGLRVLEASRVLAVPLCGAILGALGAEVTKLEDLPRLDMYRRRGPYVDGEPGPERGAYFALMNHSKASASFDVDADGDRLTALVACADVVIENLGRKRSTALGLDPTVAPVAHPHLLAICSSGFGQDGPHARYRAYAYNLQASCALGYLTRTEAGESAEIDIAWADLIAAYALATIVAAWAVGPRGNAGVGLDFAMADLVVSHFNEAIAAASLGVDDDDRANELAPYDPNDVFPAADGWVAVSVSGGQVVDVDHLDEEDAVAAASRLRAAGVFAEACATPADLVASEQLASRGMFVPVAHPDWGERRLVGIPWRPVGASAIPLRPPPLLNPT
jgi:crotonobetainyl-CoA:carnitine CoA-transferase CaiB-like acyl-CoA transferase